MPLPISHDHLFHIKPNVHFSLLHFKYPLPLWITVNLSAKPCTETCGIGSLHVAILELHCTLIVVVCLSLQSPQVTSMWPWAHTVCQTLSVLGRRDTQLFILWMFHTSQALKQSVLMEQQLRKKKVLICCTTQLAILVLNLPKLLHLPNNIHDVMSFHGGGGDEGNMNSGDKLPHTIISVKILQNMLSDINTMQLSGGDQLGIHVYYYTAPL